MSLSKETEVIFDEHRGVDYDSANPPLYDSSTCLLYTSPSPRDRG